MKNLFWFLIALFLAMADLYAGTGDSDTAWTLDLWQLGTQIYKVQFTPDGKNVAASMDGGVYFFDILTGNMVKKFQGSIYSEVDFVFSDNGKIMVTASQSEFGDKSSVAIWDIEKHDTIKTLNGLLLQNICLINDSLLIGIGKININDTTSIYKININTWQILNKVQIQGTNLAIDRNHNIFSFASRYQDPSINYIELWDLTTIKKITTLGYHNHLVQSMTFTTDGKYLASASRDGVINIWDINTKKLYKSLIHDSLQAGYMQVAFSPNNGYLVSSGGPSSVGFTTKIWDMNNFKIAYQYPNPFGAADDIDISQDSSFIIDCGGSQIFLLNAHWKTTGIIESSKDSYQMLFPNPSGNTINIPIELGISPRTINILTWTSQNQKKNFKNTKNILK